MEEYLKTAYSNVKFVFQKHLTKDQMKKYYGKLKAAWQIVCVCFTTLYGGTSL